mgnify:CR=1 FL=1
MFSLTIIISLVLLASSVLGGSGCSKSGVCASDKNSEKSATYAEAVEVTMPQARLVDTAPGHEEIPFAVAIPAPAEVVESPTDAKGQLHCLRIESRRCQKEGNFW